MQAPIFLAKLMGPILALAGLAMLVNRKGLEALAEDFLRNRALFFLLGLIDFAVGLAIVLTHNVWVADWRIIITLLGWLLLARGVVRTLVPDRIKPLGLKLVRNQNVMAGSVAVVLVLGLVLSYFGYVR